LYSVGPDGKDGGGVGIDGATAEQPRYTAVNPDSKGDIVLGHNLL